MRRHLPAQRLRWVARALGRSFEAARDRLASTFVAARLEATLQLGNACATWVEGDRSGLGNRIAVHSGDARLSAEHAFDNRLLACELHAAGVQHSRHWLAWPRLGGARVWN
jgi:hypothetical protein